MNKILIKFFGMRRNGNHAAINWILGLAENPVFLNMVTPYSDPVATHAPVSIPNGVISPKKRVNNRVEVDELFSTRAESSDLQLVSFENYPIKKFDDFELSMPIYNVLGNFDQSINIIVIRNPFNVVPSLFNLMQNIHKTNDQNEVLKSVKNQMNNWKSYASIAVNPNTYSRGNFIVINYDLFIVNKSYRDALAAKLGRQNYDKNLSFISDAGGGSSFSEDMQHEQLLSRWQALTSDQKNLFYDDKELIDFGVEIWGENAMPAEFSRKHE